ncbi:unnamed protein product [Spodoptera exigua]|nr:unnamed protein product [Spodoptera exigua]
MKSRNNSFEPQPELQELLQKPHSLKLIPDGKRATKREYDLP